MQKIVRLGRALLGQGPPPTPNPDAPEELEALRRELETYKHAFETTVRDRNIWKARSQSCERALEWALEHPQVLREPALPPFSGAPGLVCVGAQKSATSFLYSMVREHPAVTVAPKDTGTVSSAPVVFEADLIDREDSVQEIRAANPDARIVVCLRNPVERAISEYRMRVRQGREERSLEEAFSALESTGPCAYIRRSLYANDVARFKESFREVLLLIAEDDMSFNIFRLFLFMGLRDADALRIAGDPPMKYHDHSRASAQAEHATMLPELAALHNFELATEWKTEIFRQHFANDVARIEHLIGRDLSIWRPD